MHYDEFVEDETFQSIACVEERNRLQNNDVKKGRLREGKEVEQGESVLGRAKVLAYFRGKGPKVQIPQAVLNARGELVLFVSMRDDILASF